MKYNKGFIGVGMIVAIIAILAVGGGAVYYATKTPALSSNTEENNYQPQINQNSTIPPNTNTQANNSNTSVNVTPSTTPKPIITSISPVSGTIGSAMQINGKNLNGFEGETYLYITKANGESGMISVNSYLPTGATTLKFNIPDKICTKNNTQNPDVPCPSYMTMTPGVYKIYAYPWGDKSNEVQFTVTQSSNSSVNQGAYKNQNYNLSVNYSNDSWVPASDVGMYLLNKEINFERLLTLVKKSTRNGKQCTDANSNKPISCNSTLESIKFAVINKTLDEVKASIPSYALTGYDGHTGYNSTCAPLNLSTYSGKKPSACAFSGFEWDEHAEYFYPIGNKTLVVNWNYYDADKSVYVVSEKNFLDVMSTFKLGQ